MPEPYHVPTMAEIAAVPWNGFTVASTFSGCGGSCLGYRMAGFKVAWASEFIPAAAEVYRANHPDTILDTRDIRKVQPAEILAAIGLGVGELDLLDGSPPCASFSTAGKREKHWGKAKRYSETVQRVDDLFFEYVRLLGGLRPKVFVAENVSGLVKGVAKGYFLEILAKLKSCGYRVGVKVLDAQWLGVPQARQRTIFIGVREDLGREPAFPRPLPYRYTLRDALPWILHGKYGPAWKPADAPSPTVSAHPSYNPQTSHQGLELVEAVVHDTCGKFPSYGDVTDRPCPTITVEGQGQFKVQLRGDTGAAFAHKGKEFSLDEPAPTILGTKPNQLSLSRFAIGPEWDKLKPGESSAKYFNLLRPHPDQPCPTICASHGHPGVASVTHPTEKRKLSIAELKRICAFPDDFVLTGTYSQQWERLGRAVPPVMMFQVARTIRDEILT
ncbi:MAG: DNA cytosine methyltransferase [Limisphaerales bacterium]